MDLALHLDSEDLGHRDPDGFSEVVLNVGRKFREAIAVSTKHVILGIGHIA